MVQIISEDQYEGIIKENSHQSLEVDAEEASHLFFTIDGGRLDRDPPSYWFQYDFHRDPEGWDTLVENSIPQPAQQLRAQAYFIPPNADKCRITITNATEGENRYRIQVFSAKIG